MIKSTHALLLTRLHQMQTSTASCDSCKDELLLAENTIYEQEQEISRLQQRIAIMEVAERHAKETSDALFAANQSIDDIYNFVGRDFAHLEPKRALEAHMAAVVKDAVAELEQRGEPEGWKLVPKMITQQMHDCGYAAWKESRIGTGLCDTYYAMLAAAPSPEEE